MQMVFNLELKNILKKILKNSVCLFLKEVVVKTIFSDKLESTRLLEQDLKEGLKPINF